MTESYPLPPPFSDDEVLQLLQPRSVAPPTKRANGVAAGVAAAVILVGLGVGGFVLVGSDPASRDGTAARIEASAPAAPQEPVASASVRGASVAEPSATDSVAPPAPQSPAEPAAPPPPVTVAPSAPAPLAVTAPPPASAPLPSPAEAQPPGPSAPARPEPLRRLASEEIRLHLERGETLLAQGDLAAARLFFERVAEAGDARGAFGLARSYDPSVLIRLPVHSVAGNLAEAERWRRIAASLAPAFAERR